MTILLLACALLAAPVPVAPAEAPARIPPGASEGARPGPATAPAEVPLAGYSAGGVRVPSSAEAWGGERDGKPTLSDRVVRYQIKARLDPKKHTIDATEKLTWKNRSAQPIHSIYLHLYLNAFENEGSTFMREKGQSGFRGLGPDELKKAEWGFTELGKVEQAGARVAVSFVHPDGGPETDHTVVRLDLPQAVPPGGSTTIDIAFHDQLPRVVARTGWFGNYHLVGQWFPKVGVLELLGERGAKEPRWNCHEFHLHSEFYADFGSYDVELTAPKGYTVGATGESQGPPRETPEGLVHRYLQDDVHDFAWTAWDGYAKPLTDRWTHPGSPEVKVSVLYPPEYEASAAPALEATKAALTWFSDTLGPYPYRTVTAVIPPYNAAESGGMEYPTFFTTIGSRDYNKELPLVDFVTIHEFGHGYFYGLLASNEFEEPYLDEGMNELWDMRMMDANGYALTLRTDFMRLLGIKPIEPITPSITERGGGAQRRSPDSLADNSWHRIGNYGWVYAGTAVWFGDLERRLGGDTFARAYKEYYRRWKFRHPSTADLKQVLAEVSGQPELIAGFFDKHVLAGSALDDRLVSLKSEEELPDIGSIAEGEGRRERDAKAQQKEVKAAREAWEKAHPDDKKKGGPGPYPYRTTIVVERYASTDIPQELLVKFVDGSEQRLKWAAGEAWHKFELTTPSRAVSALLDPDGKLRADQSKLDDGRTIERHRLAAHRWTFELGSWLQVALALAEAL